MIFEQNFQLSSFESFRLFHSIAGLSIPSDSFVSHSQVKVWQNHHISCRGTNFHCDILALCYQPLSNWLDTVLYYSYLFRLHFIFNIPAHQFLYNNFICMKYLLFKLLCQAYTLHCWFVPIIHLHLQALLSRRTLGIGDVTNLKLHKSNLFLNWRVTGLKLICKKLLVLVIYEFNLFVNSASKTYFIIYNAFVLKFRKYKKKIENLIDFFLYEVSFRAYGFV